MFADLCMGKYVSHQDLVGSGLKNQVSLTWAEFKLVHEIGHFSFSQLSCSVLEDNRDNG